MAQDAANKAVEAQNIQRRLQQLDRNLAQLEQSMQELHTAIATIEGITGGEHATMVPVGAGVRIPAKVDGAANVLLDLGSGYSTELAAPEALTHLRDRLTRTESAFRSMGEDADKTAQQLQALQMQMSAPPS